MRNNLMGWQPDHANNKLAYAFGFIGALYQWLKDLKLYMDIQLPIDYASTAIKGMITAGLCGFAGMFGKWVFEITKKYLTEYFQRKNKTP
jgi:hypothetical protein